MTAGRGIVHSERTAQELRGGPKLFGIQSWVALPAKDEETEPDFVHLAARSAGAGRRAGSVHVIAGSILGLLAGEDSSPMFYADISLRAGATLPLDPAYDERAIYTVSGEIEIAGDVSAPPVACFQAGRPHHGPGERRRPLMCSVGSRWMARATSGGTSCPPGRTASSRPRPIGRRRGSTPCRATASSSPFPNPSPDESLQCRREWKMPARYGRRSDQEGAGPARSVRVKGKTRRLDLRHWRAH